jgi:hypothetical protein
VPISLADIQRWDPEQINEVADAAAARARTSREKADDLRNLSAFDSWNGDAAETAPEAITESRTKLELSAQEALLVSLGASRAYQEAQAVTKEVSDLLAYAAEAPAVEINTVSNTVTPPDTTGWAPEDVANAAAKVAELESRITAALAHAEATDDDLARVLSTATGDDDVKVGTDTSARNDPKRRQASTKAFEEVFGRPPTSASDWTTAEALNPNSYDPLYQGAKPEIRVAKIEPVPGQGVVRVSQYIEQRDVSSWPPGKRDFGSDRLATPTFDPEDTKVTTYIDYENGIVVMRQNPSVELNDNGVPGQVKVGVPEAKVWQTSDGAVRVQYDAGNPFAPGIATDPPWPMENNAITVNGDLVFTPTADGVRVDGTRTNYPSMEVYQDLPNGSTRTVIIDPAAAGSSVGPGANLWRHHELGAGGSAFEPFDTGGWNPNYDVRAPLPPTEFGTVTNPPSVPPSRLPAGTTQF